MDAAMAKTHAPMAPLSLPGMLKAMREVSDAVKALAASDARVRSMFTHPALHMPDQVDDLYRYEDLGDEKRIRNLFDEFVSEFVRHTGNARLDTVLGDWHARVMGRPMLPRAGATLELPRRRPGSSFEWQRTGARDAEDAEDADPPAPDIGEVTPLLLPPKASQKEAPTVDGDAESDNDEEQPLAATPCGADEWTDAWASLSQMDRDVLTVESVDKPRLLDDLKQLTCDLVVAALDPAKEEALSKSLRADALAEAVALIKHAEVDVPRSLLAIYGRTPRQALGALVRRALDLSSPLATLMGGADDAQNLIGSIRHLQLRRLLEHMELTGEADARLLPMAQEYQKLLGECAKYKRNRQRWFATLRGYRRDDRLERDCPRAAGLLKQRVDVLVALLEEIDSA